jgi:hypothetical protein
MVECKQCTAAVPSYEPGRAPASRCRGVPGAVVILAPEHEPAKRALVGVVVERRSRSSRKCTVFDEPFPVASSITCRCFAGAGIVASSQMYGNAPSFIE